MSCLKLFLGIYINQSDFDCWDWFIRLSTHDLALDLKSSELEVVGVLSAGFQLSFREFILLWF